MATSVDESDPIAICYRCLDPFVIEKEGTLGMWNKEGSVFIAMTNKELWTGANGNRRTTTEVERMEFSGLMSFYCTDCVPLKGDLRRDVEMEV